MISDAARRSRTFVPFIRWRILRHVVWFSALCLPAISALADWPTFHGDYALRGVGTLARSEVFPPVFWRYDSKKPMEHPPVAGGGRIYAVTGETDIVALDREGQELWRASLAGSDARRRTSMAAAPLYYRGRVAVAMTSGEVIALDAATGAERWRAALGGAVGAALNWIASNRTAEGLVIGVVQSRGIVIALDGATGDEVWRSAAFDRCDSPPSCGEGRIVLGSCLAALHALDARDGAERFRTPLGDDSQMAGGAALDRGVAFGGNRSGALVAVELASGRILWRTEPRNAEVFATPAVAGDRVLFAAADGTVSAVERATGAVRWTRKLGAGAGEVAVGGDRAVVAVDGRLIILDARTGEERGSVQVSDRVVGPVLTGGLIVVGTDEGQIVAYGSPTRPASP